MGVNQSYEGTRTAQAIINLALITGNIGRPGTGANSITGQCNAMGSRLWSNTTNLVGHHRFTSADDRAKVANILHIEPSRIPTRDSWSYDRILRGVREGDIKGLWIIATNPAHSWIDQGHARELLDQLDFLVVQDMYDTTDTAMQADLVLPAAGWGEKEGTFINSERRYGLLKKVKHAPGKALADFQIFRAIAHAWGCGEMLAHWKTPEDVFQTMQRLSAGMPNDITGIGSDTESPYQHLDRCGGIQWPWASGGQGDPATERRLFAEGIFPTIDGRAKLIVDEIATPPEPTCPAYPIWLMTGRGTVSQWHTQTRTSQSPVLRKLYPGEAYIELNPVDAKTHGITHGQKVRVASRRSSVEVNAMVVPTIRRGHAFLPMHYDVTNQLTLSHFDPHSRQPSYKDCAVSLEAIG